MRMAVMVIPKSGERFRYCLCLHHRIAVHNVSGNRRQLKMPNKNGICVFCHAVSVLAEAGAVFGDVNHHL